MSVLDRNLIENFAKDMDQEMVEQAIFSSMQIISSSIDLLKAKNPFLSGEYQLVPFNEFYSGAVLPNSNIDFLLIIDNAQIKLNTESLINNKFSSFKMRLKIAWKNRKKKKKKRKKKKNQPLQEETNLVVDKKEKYSLPVFNKDLLNAIAENITDKDFVSIKNGILSFEGENIPFKVRIFTVFPKSEDEYEIYSIAKNKFLNFNLKARNKLLTEFIDNTNSGEQYIKLCQVFASLFFNIMDEKANNFFIESLVANLPSEAFEQDIYNNFIFAINYFVNTPLGQLVAITDTNKKICDDELCNISLTQIHNFLKKIADNVNDRG